MPFYSNTIPTSLAAIDPSQYRDRQASSVPGAPDATLIEIGLDADGNQINLVRVCPFGIIPNHTHTCASGMGITAGSAVATGKEGGDRQVGVGDYIFKPPGQAHGFRAGSQGLEFLSISDGEGIVGDRWDIEY
jgi:quercetin dioxygenase-like cupin family protein